MLNKRLSSEKKKIGLSSHTFFEQKRGWAWLAHWPLPFICIFKKMFVKYFLSSIQDIPHPM